MVMSYEKDTLVNENQIIIILGQKPHPFDSLPWRRLPPSRKKPSRNRNCAIVLAMASRSRILIADDHTLIAELCKKLLEMEFDVVGTVSDGHALVRAAHELKPDVIVVDIAMPILNGLDAGQQVKEMLPAVKLVYPDHES